MRLLSAAVAGLGVVGVLVAGGADSKPGEDAGTPALAHQASESSVSVAAAELDGVAGIRVGPEAQEEGEDHFGVPRDELTRVINRTCVACHNDEMETGNLSLQHFDVARAPEMAERAEKMVQKLHLDMMPPPGMPRPGGDTLDVLVETLEADLDAAHEREPNPGSRPFQRLNQAEYERAIEDLLGLRVDAGDWLPDDQISENFDNIADVQDITATLMDGYLNAASEIARMTLGFPDAPRQDRTYTNSRYVSQHEWERLEGAPYGTRGGISVVHNFPADGYYVFDLEFHLGLGERFHDIDVSIDGDQVAFLPYGGEVDFQGRGDFPIRTDSVFIPAGQQRVTAAFVRQQDGPYSDLIQPHEWSMTGTEVSDGTTSPPHIREMTISGPHRPTGKSSPPSRDRILTCEPDSADEGRVCAREILTALATKAYRRPLTERDEAALMDFYEEGLDRGGDFDDGIRAGLEAILASPYFLFRFEERPADVAEGEVYRISDLELASRLSFFLWGRLPDEELLEVAQEGQLSQPKVLEEQVRRMLRDPRAEALGSRFVAQWFRLQDLDRVQPDVFWFPDYDAQLARFMRQETELFFTNLVQEDRSLLELYNADYTFVNERLARHYGISDVVGEEFRRVMYPEDSRRKGVLGHGSVLLSTSLGNRTSPVLRGLWVMEVLLDSPPPPPPPVPALEETASSAGGQVLTTRERLEIHRDNPTCNSCHQFIDPLGVALDNFDVTGQWRVREREAPLDTRGELWDGTRVENAKELSDALLERPTPLVRTFTKNLMAYALGRRVDYQDGPTIRQITKKAEENDYRMSSFILGVVHTDAFQMQRAGAVAEERNERQR